MGHEGFELRREGVRRELEDQEKAEDTFTMRTNRTGYPENDLGQPISGLSQLDERPRPRTPRSS